MIYILGCFYNYYFILLWMFTVVVKMRGIVIDRLFIWTGCDFVNISGVCKYIKERLFFFY